MSELEAGDALDELIAVKVMGAERLESCGLHHNCKKDAGRYGWLHANGIGNHHLPDYSTDIGTAWLVLEHFQAVKNWCAPYLVPVGGDGSESNPSGWIASFDLGAPDAVFAKTAPLAICRAALRAVEG